jgi:hypothetical protein
VGAGNVQLGDSIAKKFQDPLAVLRIEFLELTVNFGR